MKNIIAILIFPLLITSGCSGKKSTTKTSAPSEKEKVREEQTQKEGYIKATVVDKSKSECGFTLVNASTGETMLPINLEDNFKQDGIQVWLKYRPIKPVQAVCIVGTPITIEEIKIIE